MEEYTYFEQWHGIRFRGIYGFDKYYVGEDGTVISTCSVKPKKLTVYYNAGGYQRVRLYAEKYVEQHFVHRLVCFAFYGPPPTDKHVVDHIDTDVENNHYLNLRWCTRSENLLNPITREKVRLGKQEPPRMSRIARLTRSINEAIKNNPTPF